MGDRTKIAVLKAGIVPQATIPELERWGLRVPEGVQIEPDRRSALDNIREAVESRETVERRETSLDALKIYGDGQKVGRLYYAIPDNSVPGVKKSKMTFTKVSYAVTSTGFYLIPWTGEDIHDVMLDDETHLKPEDGERIYFIDVSDFYYGEQKAFMVCKPLVRTQK